MKKLLFVIASIISLSSLAQEKIGNKIYSYGNLENSIKGKTLIRFLVNDPKEEIEIMDKFKDAGVKAVSWNKLFIPNFQYSAEEFNTSIQQNKIETIIIIRVNGVGTYTVAESYTSAYSNNTMSTFGTSGKGVKNVNLSMDIYNNSNNFSKPVAVVNGEANNSWSGTQRGITDIIIKRIINALEDEKAF